MTPSQAFQLQLNGVEVAIWQLDLTASADPQSLSPDEHARAERLLDPAKRRQFSAARAGLREILGAATRQRPAALVFGANNYGKPFLRDNQGIEFNVTHADDIALIAVAGRAVGIDLEHEQVRSNLAQMAQIAFSPAELAAWNALPDADQLRAFYRVWTRKEALMKGQGEGFRLAYAFSVPLAEQAGPMTVGDWTITDLSMPSGWFAALALGPDARAP